MDSDNKQSFESSPMPYLKDKPTITKCDIHIIYDEKNENPIIYRPVPKLDIRKTTLQRPSITQKKSED